MATGVRFILLNGDEAFGAELRATLLQFNGVKIAAEVDQVELLLQTIHQIPAEILLVNLDPRPEWVLDLAAEIASAHPTLSVFATSASTDAKLLLDVMRKGIRHFLPRPIDPQAMAESIEKVVQKHAAHTPQGKLITILSGCGGQGATMLATNLAVELADASKSKVVLVDLDYRYGQVATFMDLEPTHTIADLCNTIEQVEQSVIEKALITHESGVRVLARPAHIAQAESITAAHCVGVLSTLSQFNDYVIVDGPTRFDVGAPSVLDLADINLLIVQLLVPSVRNTVRIIDAMKEAGYNMERLHLICNRVGKESSHLALEDVRKTLDLNVLVAIPDDWATVGGAVNLGLPLMEYTPKGKVRQAIRELAEKLHKSDEEDIKSAGERKKGLMGSLFRL